MTGSGILLGSPKAKKKFSKSVSHTTLTPEVQANTTIKLFLEDVSGRLKSHLKKCKSQQVKLFISFFSKLSAEPDPIHTLSALQINALSDFLGFLETAKTKLVSPNSGNASETYQLLTENLDSTAALLSRLLAAVETDDSVLNILRQYLSNDLLPAPSSKRRDEAPTLETQPSRIPTQPTPEKTKSNGSSHVLRKASHHLLLQRNVNGDFGI